MDVVTIYNMALSHLLISRQVDDVEEDSQEANTCNLWFERVRNQVLRDHPWDFAERFAELALIEEDPNHEWDYSYRVPTGFLAARRIAVDGSRDTTNRIPYKVATDDDGGVIWTDEPDAWLVYTAEITDPTLFPEDFAQALSLRLAWQIAKPLAASQAIAAQCLADYQAAVTRAVANSRNEQQPDDEPEAESIRARER
jgi:hypothetical protein